MGDYGGTIFDPHGRTSEATRAILARYQRRQGPNGMSGIRQPGLCELIEGVALALEADDDESVMALAQRMDGQPTRHEVTNLELNTMLGTLPTIRALVDYYQSICETALKQRGYNRRHLAEALNETYVDPWPSSEGETD